MDSLDKFADDGLEALQRAVNKALDRKRRLGQYAVFWEDDRIVFVGPDAPQPEELPDSGNYAWRDYSDYDWPEDANAAEKET